MRILSNILTMLNYVHSDEHCYHPLAIANYFIFLSKGWKNRHYKLTLLKIIKLTYIANAWSLYFYQRPLLDEAVEAWVYGPVIPSVYYNLNVSGKNRLKKPYSYYDLTERKWLTPMISNDVEIENVIELVWFYYHKFHELDLSKMTRTKHSAWYRLKKEFSEKGKVTKRNQQIPNKYIIAEQEKIFHDFEKKSGQKITSLEQMLPS